MLHDPFHDGEIAVQTLTGERPAAIVNGRVIADAVPIPAVGFVAQQDMVVLSRTDESGAHRAAVAMARAGFATVSDDRRRVDVELDTTMAAFSPNGPLADLAEDDRVGGLFIELATRRRLRVNGRITKMGEGGFSLAIAEAYPACPKYIQRRVVEAVGPVEDGDQTIATGTDLTDDLRSWIEGADTLFVASGNPDGELDVSHRGGASGFVRVVDGALSVPDYPGNSMFNTLGNLTLDPRAGLVIPDFATGAQLCLTGTVELDLATSATDPNDPTGGSGRWWTFNPTTWHRITPTASRRWSAADPSPFNPVPESIS